MPYAKSRGRGAAAASTPTANQIKRDSRLYLTVKPVNISLTDGTNIPPPPPSPPPAPAAAAAIAENHNSNNLTPHLPGSFPSDNPTSSHVRKSSLASTTDSNAPAPLTATDLPPREENPPRPSTAIRRMFSLNNLRQSFSSSRTSLALPRTSNDPATGRPKSPSVASTMASVQPADNERPGTSATTKKRRGSWFGSSSRRRSSGFWNQAAGDTGSSAGLESVMEEEGGAAGAGTRGAGNTNKRVRDSRFAAPRLPDVGTLRGGRLDGGDLGWDEGMFRKKE